MKGLLIKDFKFIKKHNFGFIIVSVLFLCIAAINSSSMYFAYYSGAMISLMPIFTMAYDEHYNWNKYEAVLPIKKSIIVLEKYVLLAIISVPAVMIEAFVFHYVKGLSMEHTASLAYLMLFVSLISPAIVL
ncbi:MAG: ABC-2 transporter permease, partial [Eubacterium sp.]|nr:ABC-2 transporter permease [Eubacterium sp.]